MITSETQTPWYKTLIAHINELAEELGLDEQAAARMRDFVIREAKHQYLAGNRAGIYWARGGRNEKKIVNV